MTSAILFVALVAAERPQLVSGRLSFAGPASNLAAAIDSLASGWAGYAVPMVGGSHSLCGSDDVVTLDDRSGSTERDRGPARSLFVLHRIQNGRLVKLRLLSSSCRVDAGSVVLSWWEPVSPRASLEHLKTLVSGPDEDLAEEAVQAVALHADPVANGILADLLAGASSFEVRKSAGFWLGAARGEEGFRVLAGRFPRERDQRVRQEMVFAIHVSKAEGSVPKLIEIARNDPEDEVREKALFWLAQRAGAEASRAIASAVREDPDLEVKKQAVFALSQLPPDEGVPLLVEVAESHPQPEVRERAFFWLGQSGDPRALELFERVLLRR